MKVVLFHPTLLPPKDYGGVERVVLWLAQGLVERGHEVHVGAHRGSRLPQGVRLLEFDPERSSAEDLLERLPSGVDAVHFMAPPEAGVLERLPCAGVLTVHGNGKPGEVFPVNSVFLSRDHAERHGAREFVYNGVDPNEYRFRARKKPEFLFLSKTTWRVKNVAGAVKVCSRAGVRLAVAGGNRPLGTRLRVMAHPRMRWVGPVAGERKAELLADARALVFPVRWPEPFGLVMAEALISGTPVIGARRGSVPEIVPPEVGAVFEPEEFEGSGAVAGLLRKVISGEVGWDPEVCRRWAMERFHYLKMAESYEGIYRRVASGEALHTEKPVAGNWRME